MTESNHDDTRPAKSSLTVWQMVSSILASFFGVQSSRNQQRDFALGKARAFILVGIVMTAVWYGAIYAVVHLVLAR